MDFTSPGSVFRDAACLSVLSLTVSQFIRHEEAGSRIRVESNKTEAGFSLTDQGVDVTITIFCNFCKFSANQIGVFLKNQCYDDFFFQKLEVV
jgi:hypothetical protein